MILAGLDCGKKGALVAVDFTLASSPRLLAHWATDDCFLTFDGAYADGVMRSALVRLLDLGVERVVVERQQAHPDDGVHNAFAVGQGFGLWVGLLRGVGLRYALVHPLSWQPGILPGPAGGDTKKRAAQLVRARIPELAGVMARPNTRKGFHDGLADAGALCLYGLKAYGPQASREVA